MTAGGGGAPRGGAWARAAGAALMALSFATIVAEWPTPTGASSVTAPQVPAKPSPGCAHAPASSAQSTLNFAADGDAGSYTEQVPATAEGRPLPVVFDFHGYQEPGPAQVVLTGLGTYGQAHGFITITPWVNGRPVPRWISTLGSADLAWFGQLMDHVEATSCIDENRVFVTGYSNGAFMASAIACQYPAQVAAAAPVSGIQAMAPCKRSRPVPVVAFHGTADPLIHYNGTPSRAAARLTAPDGSHRPMSRQAESQFGARGVFQKGPTIPQEAAAWAKRNGCGSKVTTTAVTRDVTRLTWSCRRGADVELYRITGGGHTWPGSQALAAASSMLGRTTLSVSANAVMWNFFVAHPLSPSD